ncbi:hypothetical protein INS49_004270 [Diaporthe citri]|uniref:uncharacterized protein n=1 Tax=Diaporthe citri TaxID=83186 RepID=UPI001C7F3311|nr:uncharacterized protein INS49_004270 [Diaporthe citri]KAG6355189.1 hypothetical protein INS49_004270 [Diaporthe citri]
MGKTDSTEALVQDAAYVNGEIIENAYVQPAQALLILGGKIVAVGTNKDVAAVTPVGVKTIDLKGAVVIPGLIDNHPHLLHFAAFKAPLVDIQDAASHEEIIERIRVRAAETPKGNWIMCTPIGDAHYFQRKSYKTLKEGTFPNRTVLDQATSDHPVGIQAWALVLPNIASFNSKALEILGITKDTPDRVSDVFIEKDEHGIPTGIVRGHVTNYYNTDPYWQKLAALMPPVIQPELLYKSLVDAMAGYNAMGVTAIHESHAMDISHVDFYKLLKAQNALSLRVQCSHELEPSALGGDKPQDLDGINARLRYALDDTDLEDDWLRICGITTCAFGSSYCGYFAEKRGYLGPFGERTTGKRQIDAAKIEAAVDFCARTGLKLNMLSCSPDEHDEYIHLLKEVKRKYGIAKLEWLLEHGYVMRPDQPKQLKDLGLDIAVSSSFTYGKGDMIIERFGEDYISHLNIFRCMFDAGLKPAASMDLGPTSPWEQMQLAVTHTLSSGRSNANLSQVVSREQAYEMWTCNGASVIRWRGIGDLAVGSHADIAIIDRNPITCPIESLPQTQVLRTIVGGKVVYDSESHLQQ